MHEEQLTTVAQLRAFLDGTEAVRFEPRGDDDARYAFIAKVIKRLGYGGLPRAEKGGRITRQTAHRVYEIEAPAQQ